MQSDKLFDEINLKKELYGNKLIYIDIFTGEEKIIFYLKYKYFVCDMEITTKVFHALSQKMKELGWYNGRL